MSTVVSSILQKYFGLLLLAAFPLALFLPSTAKALQPLATTLLFVQMFVISISIDWSRMHVFVAKPREILLGNLFVYFISPFVIFILATLLLSTESYRYGMLFAALTPTAIVAPLFTRLLGGNQELSFGILISSMLIAPFAIPALLFFLLGGESLFSPLALFIDIAILVLVPTILALIAKKVFVRTSQVIERWRIELNFLLLFLLVFILVGTSFFTLDFNRGAPIELWWLLLLFLVQDFSLLILWKIFSPSTTSSWIAIMLSASMKNIAISAGILVGHDPVAAVAPMIGFIPQAIVFTPWILEWFGRRRTYVTST